MQLAAVVRRRLRPLPPIVASDRDAGAVSAARAVATAEVVTTATAAAAAAAISIATLAAPGHEQGHARTRGPPLGEKVNSGRTATASCDGGNIFRTRCVRHIVFSEPLA